MQDQVDGILYKAGGWRSPTHALADSCAVIASSALSIGQYETATIAVGKNRTR